MHFSTHIQSANQILNYCYFDFLFTTVSAERNTPGRPDYQSKDGHSCSNVDIPKPKPGYSGRDGYGSKPKSKPVHYGEADPPEGKDGRSGIIFGPYNGKGGRSGIEVIPPLHSGDDVDTGVVYLNPSVHHENYPDLDEPAHSPIVVYPTI